MIGALASAGLRHDPLIIDEVVVNHSWITMEQMMDMITIAEMTRPHRHQYRYFCRLPGGGPGFGGGYHRRDYTLRHHRLHRGGLFFETPWPPGGPGGAAGHPAGGGGSDRFCRDFFCLQRRFQPGPGLDCPGGSACLLAFPAASYSSFSRRRNFGHAYLLTDPSPGSLFLSRKFKM